MLHLALNIPEREAEPRKKKKAPKSGAFPPCNFSIRL